MSAVIARVQRVTSYCAGVIMTREIRRDPYLDTPVHIVGARQNRPNLPVEGCPFCVGGLEAPEPYDVRAFPNRWPALEDGYCEVVLYSPVHDATFGSLGVAGVSKVVDLWKERTSALQQLPNGEYVLIFENRGAEIGATISHPHGQIYAFDHVPPRQARQIRAQWMPEEDPGDRLVMEHEGWRVWTEYASVHPISLRIAPRKRISHISDIETAIQQALSEVLVKIFSALDALFGTPLPYMMWINQSPRTRNDWPDCWFNFEIISPWRSAGVPRYIAAAEVSTEEYFNPVDPAEVAMRLRTLLS